MMAGSCSLFDFEPPEITIVSPLNNAIVSNTFLMSGTASDDVSLKSVTYKINNGTYSDADGKEEWSQVVVLSGYGTYIITVRAEDYNGNYTQKSILVTYPNPASP
jgi:hypothetical protein